MYLVYRVQSIVYKSNVVKQTEYGHVQTKPKTLWRMLNLTSSLLILRGETTTLRLRDVPSNSNDGGESFNPVGPTATMRNLRFGGGNLLLWRHSKMDRTSESESLRIVAILFRSGCAFASVVVPSNVRRDWPDLWQKLRSWNSSLSSSLSKVFVNIVMALLLSI